MSSAAVMDIRQLVGLNLRRMRQARGLSQLALSADSKVGQNYISGIENGRRSPTVVVLYRLARVLDFPIVEFFAISKPKRRS